MLTINSLSNDKILGLAKLKTFADDKLTETQSALTAFLNWGLFF